MTSHSQTLHPPRWRRCRLTVQVEIGLSLDCCRVKKNKKMLRRIVNIITSKWMIAFFTVSMSLLWKWASPHLSHCVYYGHLSSSAHRSQDTFMYCKEVHIVIVNTMDMDGVKYQLSNLLIFIHLDRFWRIIKRSVRIFFWSLWTIFPSCVCPRRGSFITNSLFASCSCRKYNISYREHGFKQPYFSF